MDRIAFALQRDGVEERRAVAICARASIPYAAAFLGVLAAGAAVALLAPSSTPASLDADAQGQRRESVLLDRETADALERGRRRKGRPARRTRRQRRGDAFSGWLGPEALRPRRRRSRPTSRSTSSIPRARPARPRASSSRTACDGGSSPRVSYRGRRDDRLDAALFEHDAGRLPADVGAWRDGGADAEVRAGAFLRCPEKHRATHAMLVPVQYRRIMEREDFDATTCRASSLKFSTSAPFPAALKARRAQALAGRPRRVLRHDRGRRRDHARGPSFSRQAAHGRPADAGPRHSPDRRARPRGRARARSARWSAGRKR